MRSTQRERGRSFADIAGITVNNRTSLALAHLNSHADLTTQPNNNTNNKNTHTHTHRNANAHSLTHTHYTISIVYPSTQAQHIKTFEMPPSHRVCGRTEFLTRSHRCRRAGGRTSLGGLPRCLFGCADARLLFRVGSRSRGTRLRQTIAQSTATRNTTRPTNSRDNRTSNNNNTNKTSGLPTHTHSPTISQTTLYCQICV